MYIILNFIIIFGALAIYTVIAIAMWYARLYYKMWERIDEEEVEIGGADDNAFYKFVCTIWPLSMPFLIPIVIVNTLIVIANRHLGVEIRIHAYRDVSYAKNKLYEKREEETRRLKEENKELKKKLKFDNIKAKK